MADPINTSTIHSDDPAAFDAAFADELVEKVDPAGKEVASSGLAARVGKIWGNWVDNNIKRINEAFNGVVQVNGVLSKFLALKTQEPSSDSGVQKQTKSIARQDSSIIGDVDIVLETIAVGTDQFIQFSAEVSGYVDTDSGDSATHSIKRSFRVVGGTLAAQAAGVNTVVGTEGASSHSYSLQAVGNDVVLRLTDTAAQTINTIGEYSFQRMDETVVP